jgi:hypothetical protein
MKPEMWRSKVVQALRISQDLTDRELAENLSAVVTKRTSGAICPCVSAMLSTFEGFFLPRLWNTRVRRYGDRRYQ